MVVFIYFYKFLVSFYLIEVFSHPLFLKKYNFNPFYQFWTMYIFNFFNKLNLLSIK